MVSPIISQNSGNDNLDVLGFTIAISGQDVLFQISTTYCSLKLGDNNRNLAMRLVTSSSVGFCPNLR